MTLLVDSALSQWADWSLDALKLNLGPSIEPGFDALVNPVVVCLRGLLDKSLETLLTRKRLAFCYPDRPMLYPRSADEFWSVAGDATFVVQTLEHYGEFFRLIHCEFSRRWTGRVHVACYVSPYKKDRFGPHRDEWHVAALHVAGRKVFRFESGEAISLSSGCALAIPRGLVHHAEDDPLAERQVEVASSIHVSVALH